MPFTKRARTNGRFGGKAALRRRRRRGAVPRTGKYKGQKKLVRKTFVNKAPKALAHRAMLSRPALQWPLAAAAGAGLQPLTSSVPHQVWGSYSQGFDIAQVTSLAIYSRNVTCRTVLQPPTKSGAPQAYQFRVVTGFCKRQLNQVMASTAGTSGMSDGCILNFDPEIFQTTVQATLQDFVGTTNGAFDPAGAFDRTAFDVISDTNYTLHADATGASGETYYPSKVLNNNWATKKSMRLYPYTAGGTIPTIPDGYTPCNNATLWIPFICIMCINGSQFTGDADRPYVQNTWTHYWDQM